MSEFKSFEEFWPHYLREHTRPETRALHAWRYGWGPEIARILGLRCWATDPRGWVIFCMIIISLQPSKTLCGHFVRIS